ncbi:YjiH family protein [Sporosalibacterium faouarense]|uniref:YjiH family protein n=1 Tax=Sporosalibacterium faouarense TaxID=516123 RepID=UPI00141CFBD6|nr:YjiH family protein [Sporosalibacterium faouarense]MTI46297.1 YjiH family protein [Bacillota bacterium]
MNVKGSTKKRNFSTGEILKFIVPSFIGLLLFVIPLPWGGESLTIGVGYMASKFSDSFGEMLPAFMVYVVIVSALITLISTIIKPKFISERKFLKELLIVSPLTLAIRLISAVLAYSVLYSLTSLGLDKVSNPNTGGVVVNDLFPVLATWFFFSGFFLPLLMEFGSMDYLGTLIRKFMRPLFKVPGRSAIDAIASWIGSGPVGVVITDKQYKEGYYTSKEASIISVCFSLVSLPFAVFIASFLELSVSFIAFYGAISIASFIAALVLPRIYPLNKKNSEYFKGVDVKINEEVPPGRGIHEWAVERGIIRAEQAPSFLGLITSGLKTVVDVYFSLMPIVMLLGTFALVIAEYTSLFSLISKPLVPLFNLMRVPDASVAASATLVGFADMFLPSIFVKGCEFEITRFIIGALSFTQLIYLTETGAIILRSKIPVNFKDLLIVFLERTLVTLPIIVIIAHLVY